MFNPMRGLIKFKKIVVYFWWYKEKGSENLPLKNKHLLANQLLLGYFISYMAFAL